MANPQKAQGWQDEVKRIASGIRLRVLECTIKNNGGYLSQACSSAEILATLYVKIMNIGKANAPLSPLPFPGVPAQHNKGYFTGSSYNGHHDSRLDRFFLSPAHYALVLYAALAEIGRMAPEGLEQFNKDGSSVEMIGAEHSPGMEVMTGSLGQGISQAAGIAMGRRMKGEKGRIFVFKSDGEFQIGQTWEAMQAISFHKLDNVYIYVDVNGYQCDGRMSNVMDIEPLDKRLESFGARVIKVDGHDIEALAKTGESFTDGRPTVVLAYTDPCRGIEPLRQRIPKLHYVRFNSEEEKLQYGAALKGLKEGIGLKNANVLKIEPYPKSSPTEAPQHPQIIEIVSKAHAKNLVKWAANKPEVVALSADLTSSTEIDLFRDAYPERFFSMGVAEQNMLSFAGGLAREGYIPFVHTFAVFIYRRAYDQIAMSISYPNLPVKMFGFLPGITTPGGASHQAIEDISVMRSLPNMTIIECGDATDVETALDVIHRINGPVYVRMLRGEIPRLFKRSEPIALGKARVITTGSDIAILTSGICTEEAMRAVCALQKRGVSIQHMHISTLKPFNDHTVLEAIAEARYGVITMENHSIIGGLGTIIAENMAEVSIEQRLARIGIKDTYAHGASRQYLMREYGIDALALISQAEGILNERFNITEDELSGSYAPPVHSKAKVEAL